MNNQRWLLFISFAGLLLAGCRAPTEVDLPVAIEPPASPTVETFVPTPIPPEKTLIVCVEQEPDSLYIYNREYLFGGTGRETNSIFQAIYDGPFNVLEGSIEPVILDGLPQFEDGTARFETIEVGEFEVYLNPETLLPDNLRKGASYLPSGCHSSDCAVDYEGGPVAMDRLVLEFNVSQGVSWSDGVELTAGDSVFSYSIDRSGSTPTTKYLGDRTHSYTAIDDRKIIWTGIPGFSDLDFQTFFWHPLPRHILGDLSAEDLQENELANRSPIGWGPFQIEDWVEGDRIEAVRNPFYFRQDEGLPYFDRLIYRFLGSDPRAALQQLLTTECDVLDESLLPEEIWPDLIALGEEGRFQLLDTPAAEVVRLEFNTDPIGRPGEAFFQSLELRQAVAACIDRQRLVEAGMAGMGTLASSFHNYAGLDGLDLSNLAYNTEQAKELIRFLGWVDDDEDPETPHSGWGVPGVYNGKRLDITLLVLNTDPLDLIADQLQSMLFDCGIHLDIEGVSAEELSGGYSDGVVFSRDFDMALWSWPDWRLPLCEMFASREIPSVQNPFGVNASGFSDQAYDLACDRVLLGDHEGGNESIATMQAIFLDQLPALPLFQPPRLLALADDVCGITVDAITPSLLWEIEAAARGEGCD